MALAPASMVKQLFGGAEVISQKASMVKQLFGGAEVISQKMC
jgi:hypothetical protein